MDELLPRQHLSAVQDPPPLDEWRNLCREASDEDLRRLQQIAIASLHADFPMEQRWAIYVSFAEETMRERGVNP